MSFWDSDAGYDIRDVKHPDYAENMRAHADDLRKYEKENGPRIHSICVTDTGTTCMHCHEPWIGNDHVCGAE